MELLKIAILLGLPLLVFSSGCGSGSDNNKKATRCENLTASCQESPGTTPNSDASRGNTPSSSSPSSPQADNKSKRETSSPYNPQTAKDDSSRIEGDFLTTEDKTLSLSTFEKRPVIVMISAWGCRSCAEETKKLKEHLQAKMNGKKLPTNVDIVTILLSSSKEDAVDWQTSEGIPWTVGYQTDSQIITKYCKAMVTPCTLIRMPFQGIVFAQNGVTSPETLESFTGGFR